MGKVARMPDESPDRIEIPYRRGAWWDGVFLSVVLCAGAAVFLFMLIYGWVNGDPRANWANTLFIAGFAVLNAGFAFNFVRSTLNIRQRIKRGVPALTIGPDGFRSDEETKGVIVPWSSINRAYIKRIRRNAILRINLETGSAPPIPKKTVSFALHQLNASENDIVGQLSRYCRITED